MIAVWICIFLLALLGIVMGVAFENSHNRAPGDNILHTILIFAAAGVVGFSLATIVVLAGVQ